MKYSVDVNGTRHSIEVTPDGVTHDAAGHAITLEPIPGSPLWLLRVGDAVHRVTVRPGAAPGQYTLSLNGYRFSVDAVDERGRSIRELARATAAASGPAPLKAPMPGLITRLLVAQGDTVTEGQGLVVMEAMKMENELRSPSAGTVRAITVTPGTAVEKGAVLVELA
jgi:acetyl/propionyl-CoA carboxylase alpha subunit